MADCTILVLTYKGMDHLRYLLPSVKKAIEQCPQFLFDVLIVDNGNDEATMGFVNTSFPEYDIQAAHSNDYLFSLNPFVKDLKTPFVFILNDDMRLEENVLSLLMPLITNDDKLFSVGSNVLDWEGNGTTVGIRTLKLNKGWLHSSFIPYFDSQIQYTLYGGGGAAIFNTEKYNALGGFDTLYRPAYAEDADLGYRAWHQAWPSIFCPKAILYHRDGATIKEQFTSDDLEQKIAKNTILLQLRNTRIKGFIFWFFILLPLRLIRWKRLHKNLQVGLRMALPKFKEALQKRFSDPAIKMTDNDIINKLGKEYALKR